MWIENKKRYRIKQILCAILGLCVSLIFTSAVWNRQEAIAAKQLQGAQERLSQEVLRFHVLGNSDSDNDQSIKLCVRDEILRFMEASISEKEKESLESTREWVRAHLVEIEQTAEKVLRKNGYGYPVRAKVLRCYFPDRKYGDVLFPKGYYEALRVEIGEARGHNWWCVLYPSLCFMDATCAVVPEEGEQKLTSVLAEDDYEALSAKENNFKIKSFFYDLFMEKTGD